MQSARKHACDLKQPSYRHVLRCIECFNSNQQYLPVKVLICKPTTLNIAAMASLAQQAFRYYFVMYAALLCAKMTAQRTLSCESIASFRRAFDAWSNLHQVNVNIPMAGLQCSHAGPTPAAACVPSDIASGMCWCALQPSRWSATPPRRS